MSNLTWFLFKCLFAKCGLRKQLQKLSKKQLQEFKDIAISKEEFEMAALLTYYLEFKYYQKIENDCVR